MEKEVKFENLDVNLFIKVPEEDRKALFGLIKSTEALSFGLNTFIKKCGDSIEEIYPDKFLDNWGKAIELNKSIVEMIKGEKDNINITGINVNESNLTMGSCNFIATDEFDTILKLQHNAHVKMKTVEVEEKKDEIVIEKEELKPVEKEKFYYEKGFRKFYVDFTTFLREGDDEITLNKQDLDHIIWFVYSVLQKNILDNLELNTQKPFINISIFDEMEDFYTYSPDISLPEDFHIFKEKDVLLKEIERIIEKNNTITFIFYEIKEKYEFHKNEEDIFSEIDWRNLLLSCWDTALSFYENKLNFNDFYLKMKSYIYDRRKGIVPENLIETENFLNNNFSIELNQADLNNIFYFTHQTAQKNINKLIDFKPEYIFDKSFYVEDQDFSGLVFSIYEALELNNCLVTKRPIKSYKIFMQDLISFLLQIWELARYDKNIIYNKKNYWIKSPEVKNIEEISIKKESFFDMLKRISVKDKDIQDEFKQFFIELNSFLVINYCDVYKNIGKGYKEDNLYKSKIYKMDLLTYRNICYFIYFHFLTDKNVIDYPISYSNVFELYKKHKDIIKESEEISGSLKKFELIFNEIKKSNEQAGITYTEALHGYTYYLFTEVDLFYDLIKIYNDVIL